MAPPKDRFGWGMVADVPSADSAKSANSTVSKEANGTSLREALDQGLRNARSSPTPIHHATISSEPSTQKLAPVIATAANAEEERKQKIRVKNRRGIWLERHPEYFENADLELADPLLYDRCIRRFQSAQEREEDGKKKGYSGVMEADLWRSEAKLAAVAGKELGEAFNDDNDKDLGERQDGVKYVGDKEGNVLPEDEDEVPKTKEDGEEMWREAMTCRFLQGRDEDFDYGKVDNDDSLDVLEREEEEEKWFEEEEPEWVNGARETGWNEGETGVQDF